MSALRLLIDCLGVILSLKCTYSICRYLSPFLCSSSVQRYLHGADTYALVTGASDGIGKAIARELYSRGFNLIIHGRNEEKLWSAAKDIRKGQGPMKDIKVWVADARSPDVDFGRAVERWAKLDISLVVYNVDPYSPRPETIDGLPESILVGDLHSGVNFPFLLTRALLPKLRAASGPAEIVYVGSFGARYSMPRLLPVSPTKAFLERLSDNIVVDEQFPGPAPATKPKETNISSVYMVVGSVITEERKVPRDIFSPSSETFAKAVVDRIGCGRSVIVPYLPQAFLFGFLDLLSGGVRRTLFQRSMQRELALLAKRQ